MPGSSLEDLIRNFPAPGGTSRRSIADTLVDHHDPTADRSASVSVTTSSRAASSFFGTPPITIAPARSSMPSMSLSRPGARSRIEWVIMICPTPWVRFSRVNSFTRSGIVPPSRSTRHNSSKVRQYNRRGPRPASASA